MQIIVPMSGIGKRFIDAGYDIPKPLIKIDGKPIIEHVCNLFPGENNFIFICSREHLENTDMREILLSIKPNAKIIGIDPHKLGPVYAVSKVFDLIDNNEEVIVNYCDFGTDWNYFEFLKQTRQNNADGAIASYRGFHPHMLGSTNYAFMRHKNNWMLEIKEKEPFTNNRMEEYASNGTYYFKKGSYVKKYFQELMDLNLNLKGEFYVSLVYNLLVKDHLKVWIYEIDHMLQWGTPEDVAEYNYWSKCFDNLNKKLQSFAAKNNSINLIPAAGLGSRFAKENYSDPKPLIKVNGSEMVISAMKMLPEAKKHIFVFHKDHLATYPIEASIKNHYPEAIIKSVDKTTQGQACTCEIGLESENLEDSVLIGACDNGIIFDHQKYQELLDDETIDVIAFSFRNNPTVSKNPNAYGYYVVDENNNISDVSVKIPISKNPIKDHAVVGAFYFRKVKYFLDGLKIMYEKNIRVNNEFYVDSLIGVLAKDGKKVKVFEVDSYICWGTPNDLKTFEYWEKYFGKIRNYKS